MYNICKQSQLLYYYYIITADFYYIVIHYVLIQQRPFVFAHSRSNGINKHLYLLTTTL